MSGAETRDELRALLDAIRASCPELPAVQSPECGIDGCDRLLAELIFSFLCWESTVPRAMQAIRKIESAVVDVNELRILLVHEVATVIGVRYGRAAERAERMRATLNDIYRRQHAVSLSHLLDLPKRDARAYLDSLDAIPKYVASRVTLLGLKGHAAPVDGRLSKAMKRAGCVDGSCEDDAACALLERCIRAAELPEAYALLQHWSDGGGAFPVAAGTGSASPEPVD